MKNLNSYKKIAKEFIKEAAWDRKFGEPLPTLSSVMKEAEVDDDKIIKYKDKEGESQEMTAGAAKKQPEDHPAKIEYDKMKDDDDSGDEPKGKALGGSDFDRDFDDDMKNQNMDKDPDDIDDLSPDAVLGSDEIDTKVDDLGKEIFSIYHSGMSDQDKERYIDGLQKQIDDLKSQKESIKVIDGKKYKAIKVSKEPTKSTIHSFKKTYKKIGGK